MKSASEKSLSPWFALSFCLHGAVFAVIAACGFFYQKPKIAWNEGNFSMEITVAGNGNSQSQGDAPETSQKLSAEQKTVEKTGIKPDSIKDEASKIASESQNDAPSPILAGDQKNSEKTSQKSSAATLAARPAPVAQQSGSAGHQSASVIYCPVPPYPESARRRGIEGVVFLRVHIDENGSVRDVSVLKSSEQKEFEEAALKTVRERWRFIPAKFFGKAVESVENIKVRFVLKS